MTNNLSNTKNLMTSSFHNAVSEAKRQYDAIDRALEVCLSNSFLFDYQNDY